MFFYQALQRQSRHERAKAVRAKLEEDKKAAILARKPKTSPVRSVNPTGYLDTDTTDIKDGQCDRNGMVLEEAAIAGTKNGVAEEGTHYVPTDFNNALARSNVHRLEIARLEAELQSLERDNDNTATSTINGAVIHGLRRQLQSHRAVLLREQRVAERKAVSEQQQQQQQPTDETTHRSSSVEKSTASSTPLTSSSSAPAIISMESSTDRKDSWSQQHHHLQTDNFLDDNNNNNHNNANCLRSQSAAGSTSTTTPTTNVTVSDLDLYRRAVGFGGGGMHQQPTSHHTQDSYLLDNSSRSPPIAPAAAAVPMNQASSLARVKALAPRTKGGRHRGASSGSELYVGGLSGVSSGSGGYEKRPAWNIEIPATSFSSESDNNAAVEEKGRPYFDADTERENQYFLGLSDHFTDKQTPTHVPVRHHYGRRGQHQLVGASAAPFANDHSWQRSPEN